MLIRWLYTLLLTLASPFLLFSLYKKKAGKPCVGKRWKEHFGFTPKLQSKCQPIWIHAVSVGETIAVTPLIKQLKQRYPDTEIVITTTTATGAEQASKLGDLVTHRYMPLDFPFAVKGFLSAINPCQLIIMETELWPNTLHTVAQQGVPIKVINARLSERSCQRYAKVQSIFNQLSRHLDLVLCQFQEDAERFVRLGVDASKVLVTGSIKFDINVDPHAISMGNQLRESLGSKRPIWIASSTHTGEDEQVLQAHKALLEHSPDALLILVPRHPERFNSVFDLCNQFGFVTQRRSLPDFAHIGSAQVYLGDTMGEMLTLIQAADICFMGGSLIGDKVGGHNVLEPAALAKPILSGPSYYNFLEVVNKLKDLKAITITASHEELSQQLRSLLDHPQNMHQQGQTAYHYMSENKGAIKTTIDNILSAD
ncbi:lipid IV(A) 3-deoxy-D-manno-octulosonic acid transferase [Vibrio panuliri]|uniref:3-deoxy-D-manno-octulosonic acid transferase n=1 Tax=Vibrio panuliri TaxID=1381081 RepID=A0ABX3FBT6_9VIBR|nr:lipid IV(A) 3-deoxy-D-manno-octulosonic acid transferase [Vibrio panuliri]KAB1459204.1 3-deoxy-D-manno-octulosonic acid transferase [Vibrio panuliri]OLQ87381.1 3-deoxy-D-manno-octulosonic acid transferase [Vibrio panuliri]